MTSNVAYERSFAELSNGHEFSIARVFTLAKNHQNKLFRFFLCYCYRKRSHWRFNKTLCFWAKTNCWLDKIFMWWLSKDSVPVGLQVSVFILSWKKKSLHFENKFIFWRRNECISIENPLIFRLSPLWLNHSRHSSGKPFVELLEVLWSDGAPDHFCHFLDSFPLLRLDLKPQIDSTNHRKIGNINETLRICKQSTQTASV